MVLKALEKFKENEKLWLQCQLYVVEVSSVEHVVHSFVYIYKQQKVVFMSSESNWSEVLTEAGVFGTRSA